MYVKQGAYDPIPLQLPVGEKLGNQLKKKDIPLEFECGFSCECGTCAI